MADDARDSGICVDNDCCESLLSATSSNREHNQLSYVQRLRKRFECLAKEQEVEFHDAVNWWLQDEIVENVDDKIVAETPKRNENLQRKLSHESEGKHYSKQSSLKSQFSHDSNRKDTAEFVIIPPTPEINASSITTVIFKDYQENNETNDSDSFDEASGGENEGVDERNDEMVEEHFHRKSENNLRLSRPISITSQTSTYELLNF